MGDEIRVNKTVRIIPQKPTLKPGKKKEQEEHKHREEAGYHFQQLSKAVELVDNVLKKDKSLTGSIFIRERRGFY